MANTAACEHGCCVWCIASLARLLTDAVSLPCSSGSMEEDLAGSSPRGQQLLAELFHSSILQRNDDTLEFLQRLGASPPPKAGPAVGAAATARRFCFTADCSSVGLVSPQPTLGFSISSRADSPSPVPSASLMRRQQQQEAVAAAAAVTTPQLIRAAVSLQPQHQPTLLQACLVAQATQRMPAEPAGPACAAVAGTPEGLPSRLASPIGGSSVSVFEKPAGWGWADCSSAGGSPRSPVRSSGSPRSLGSPPLDERRQQMTRVSATIDELLSAIVGDMLVED